MEEKKNILKEEWFAWYMYFFVPIFGIYLFWKNRFYPVFIRILLTCFFVVPASILITFIVLFFTADLPDKLNSISMPAFEEGMNSEFSADESNAEAQEYVDELMYYIDEMYSDKEWYYDMNEMWVEIDFEGLKEIVTIKVFMDIDEKKGYEDEMYGAIMEYCKNHHDVKYDGYIVKVYNQNEKIIYGKKEIDEKPAVID